jgi:hypothetical protein
MRKTYLERLVERHLIAAGWKYSRVFSHWRNRFRRGEVLEVIATYPDEEEDNIDVFWSKDLNDEYYDGYLVNFQELLDYLGIKELPLVYREFML